MRETVRVSECEWKSGVIFVQTDRTAEQMQTDEHLFLENSHKQNNVEVGVKTVNV